jgi:ABC-type sugar transport system permease subunit
MKNTDPAEFWSGKETRLGWMLVWPALSTVVIVAVFPILWTVWESLHLHDLRMPWLDRPFVGLANYIEALRDPRFRDALVHTGVFVVITLAIEITAGLMLATALERVSRGRGLLRTATLLPWAIPTVVGALIWRFMFESPTGIASTLASRAGLMPPTWFADSLAAWIPLVLADAWKTTPFVALLLLAGLQNIDPALYEAAVMDGAGPWSQFVHVTLPLLRPALFVTVLFRGLDAFRVFDVVYVMTGGGPGTATEPLAVYTFNATLQNLRFGFGAALSVIIFVVAFCGALGAIRAFGADIFGEEPA